MTSKAGMSKYLNQLIDSANLERADRETLFALFVEMETQIETLRAQVNHQASSLQYLLNKANNVDAYGKKL